MSEGIYDRTQTVLSTAQRDYARQYTYLAGYDPKGLGDDKLSIVFHALARTEELQTDQKHNQHNWEISYAPYERQKLRHIPFVEDLLEQWAEQGLVEPIPELRERWPDDRRFALVLSHDVDHLVSNSVRDRLRKLPYLAEAPWVKRAAVAAGIVKACASKMRTKERWMRIDEWMDIESRYGFRSSFFFLAQPLPAPHHEDSFYSYDDRALWNGSDAEIGDIMRMVADQGWDVGLHGSTRSPESAALLGEERDIIEQTIGQSVSTVRQHHLCFDVRYTPRNQAQAGFEADSTLGSNNSADYRVGSGLPFFLYDVVNDVPLDLLEVPLVVQDVALMRVQQMDEELAVERALELIEQAAERRSAITLLWHNSFEGSSAECRAYRRMLEAASEMGAWGCSVAEMNDWWRRRLNKVKEVVRKKKSENG